MNSSNKKSKFVTKEWHVIDSQTAKDKYNQNNFIEFETETIKSYLCDYCGAFILITEYIEVNTGVNNGNDTCCI